MNEQNTKQHNRVPAGALEVTEVGKTSAQRQEELQDWLRTPDASKTPDEMPEGLRLAIERHLAGKGIKIDNAVVLKIKNAVDWRGYISKTGKNKDKTAFSALGFGEGNIALGKPVDGYQIWLNISLSASKVS